MKILNFVKYIFILTLITLFIVIFFEGILSFYFSKNYFYHKEKNQSYKSNEIFLKGENYVDPFNNQKKTYGRTLSNRYTVSMNGRWAPKTLARKYNYNDYIKGKGKGLFTDNYGFIHNGDPDRELFQDDFYNVIFIGGSTAEGANTTSSNEKTIAAQIEKILRKQNSKLNIINAGKSGYKSFDEFMMSYNLYGMYNFQEIIFFNGINDMMSIAYSKNPKWNYYEEIINWRDQYEFTFSQKHTLKIKYYIDRIKSKIISQKKNDEYFNSPPGEFLQNIFQSEKDTYESKNDETNFEILVRNYIYNLRLTKSFCEEFKIKCSFFLQPGIGGKNLKHLYEEKYQSKVKFNDFQSTINKWNYASSKLMKLIQKNENINFYDISNIFTDDKSLVYLDLVHYNDYGNKIIAEYITKNLLKSGSYK